MTNQSPDHRTHQPVQPSTPRLMALDLAFAALGRSGGPEHRLLVVGATADTMGEFLARAAGRIDFLSDANTVAANSPGKETESGHFLSSIWIAPDPATWQMTAVRIDRHLSPGAQLAVVSSGPISGLLDYLRPGALGIGKAAVRPHKIRRLLGYRSTGESRLYGIHSAQWAILRMLADRVHRPDLADRFQAAFHQSLVEPNRLRLCGITVGVSEKP